MQRNSFCFIIDKNIDSLRWEKLRYECFSESWWLVRISRRKYLSTFWALMKVKGWYPLTYQWVAVMALYVYTFWYIYIWLIMVWFDMCQIYLNNIDVFEYVSKDSNLGGNTEFFVPWVRVEGFFFYYLKQNINSFW